MPWNSTTKIMTAPLNINAGGDIQLASGVSSGDLRYCFTHGTWNRWAKYKPVKSSKISPLTEAELRELNYGLSVSVCGPHGDISTYLSNFSSQWGYDQPDGSSGERYRHFDLTNPSDITSTGYRGDANCFVNINDCLFPSSYLVNQGGEGATFRLGLNNPPTNLKVGSIDVTDLHLDGAPSGWMFSDSYFGLVFVYNGTYRLITSANPLSYNNYGSEITIPESGGALPGITSGVTYTVYPVVSYAQHSSLTSFSTTDIVMALPLLSSRTFKVSTPATTQSLILTIDSAKLDRRGRPVITFSSMYARSGSASTTISDGHYLVKSASASGDTSGAQWSSDQIATTMTSGTTYQTTVNPNVSNQGWVYVKIYRGNATEVYDEAWAEIQEYQPDLDELT